MRWCLLVCLVLSWSWMGCEDEPEEKCAPPTRRGKPVQRSPALRPKPRVRASWATKVKALTRKMTSESWRGRLWYTPQVARACKVGEDGPGAVFLPMVGKHNRHDPALGARLIICGKGWLSVTRWEIQSGGRSFAREIPSSQVYFDGVYDGSTTKKQSHFALFAGFAHLHTQTFLRRMLTHMSKHKRSTLILTHKGGTSRITLQAQKSVKKTLALARLLGLDLD